MYFRGANGIILCYDTSDQASFDNIEKTWQQQVLKHAPDQAVLMLVGNKQDKKRVVQKKEAQGWASKNGYCFFETSAKTGHNVDSLMCKIGEKYLEKRRGGKSPNRARSSNSVQISRASHGSGQS